MTLLEKKVDALIRMVLEEESHRQEEHRQRLTALMKGRYTSGDVWEEAEDLLTELGIPQKLTGFRYIVEAAMVLLERKRPISKGLITEVLYPQVAERCGTTASKVERSIRHAVEVGFDRCEPEVIRQYFGNAVSPDNGKPTNGEFVVRVAGILQRRIKGV